jgi:hypothetical protein
VSSSDIRDRASRLRFDMPHWIDLFDQRKAGISAGLRKPGAKQQRQNDSLCLVFRVLRSRAVVPHAVSSWLVYDEEIVRINVAELI